MLVVLTSKKVDTVFCSCTQLDAVFDCVVRSLMVDGELVSVKVCKDIFQ